jgi:hypothetical protein
VASPQRPCDPNDLVLPTPFSSTPLRSQRLCAQAAGRCCAGRQWARWSKTSRRWCRSVRAAAPRPAPPLAGQLPSCQPQITPASNTHSQGAARVIDAAAAAQGQADTLQRRAGALQVKLAVHEQKIGAMKATACSHAVRPRSPSLPLCFSLSLSRSLSPSLALAHSCSRSVSRCFSLSLSLSLALSHSLSVSPSLGLSLSLVPSNLCMCGTGILARARVRVR